MGSGKSALKLSTQNRKLRMEPGYLVETPHPQCTFASSQGEMGHTDELSLPVRLPSTEITTSGKVFCPPVYILFWFLLPAQSLRSPESRSPWKRQRSPARGALPPLPPPAAAATCSLKLSAERERERRGILSLSLLEK